MINSIVAGIMTVLHDEYGDIYPYRIEHLEQGFKVPCFFIRTLKVINRQFLGNRYKHTQTFEIRFHTDNKKTTNAEFHTMGDRILELLEYITEDPRGENSLLRGKNRNYIINDGVLQILVDYEFFAYKEVKPEPYMLFLKGNYKTKK